MVFGSVAGDASGHQIMDYVFASIFNRTKENVRK